MGQFITDRHPVMSYAYFLSVQDTISAIAAVLDVDVEYTQEPLRPRYRPMQVDLNHRPQHYEVLVDDLLLCCTMFHHERQNAFT